jgi:hypothetical protein
MDDSHADAVQADGRVAFCYFSSRKTNKQTGVLMNSTADLFYTTCETF